MARIRTIKPEFPQSETVGKLSRDARLLFVQLWTIVDDAGRARAASRMLASLLYPYDDDARDLIDGWLAELEEAGAIRRYEVDGARYLEIVKWLEHQKIDRPTPSRLPEYCEPSPKPREPSRALAADLGPVPVPRTSTVDHSRPKPVERAQSRFDEFWKAYPRRLGDNPRKPAEEKFNRLVKTGVDPDVMIEAVKAMAVTNAANVGTQFIPQAVTWLNQQRWADHAAIAFEQPSQKLSHEDALKMFSKTGLWSRHAPCPEPGHTGCTVPPELFAKYGLLPDGRKMATN